MMWHTFNGWLLANWIATRVICVVNGMRACGPIHGRHVSLVYWLFGLCVGSKNCGTDRIRTGEPPSAPKSSPISANHYVGFCLLFHMSMRIYLCLCIVMNGKGGGPGLSPDPRFHAPIYMTIVFVLVHGL
jgi:hypothetical protein